MTPAIGQCQAWAATSAALFGFCLVVFGMSQLELVSRLPAAVARWLPAFRFFGPSPLSWDVLVVYRPVTGGSAGDWVALSAGKPAWWAALWCPERRIGKALVDSCRVFSRWLQTVVDSSDARLFPELRAYVLRDPVTRHADIVQILVFAQVSGGALHELVRFSIQNNGESS
jgi:hypothetical protein